MTFTSYTTSDNRIGIAQTGGNDRYRLYYPGGSSKGSSNYERLFYVGEYDGGAGYDVLTVDWGQYGTSRSVTGSNGSYTVTLSSSLGTYTSFRAKNVEEIRFLDGSWLAPVETNTNTSPASPTATTSTPTTSTTTQTPQTPTWNWSLPTTPTTTATTPRTDTVTGLSVITRQLGEGQKGYRGAAGVSDVYEFSTEGISPWSGGSTSTYYTIHGYESRDYLKSDRGSLSESITGTELSVSTDEYIDSRLKSHFVSGFSQVLGVEPRRWMYKRVRKGNGKSKRTLVTSTEYARWTQAGSPLIAPNDVFAFQRDGDTWLLVNDGTAGFDLSSPTDTVFVIKGFIPTASSPITFA